MNWDPPQKIAENRGVNGKWGEMALVIGVISPHLWLVGIPESQAFMNSSGTPVRRKSTMLFFLFGTTCPTTGGLGVFSNIYLHTKGSIGTHVAEKYCEESWGVAVRGGGVAVEAINGVKRSKLRYQKRNSLCFFGVGSSKPFFVGQMPYFQGANLL